jgi:hypothetical protein
MDTTSCEIIRSSVSSACDHGHFSDNPPMPPLDTVQDQLEHAYAQVRQQTLRQWHTSAAPGEARQSPADANKVGVSTGCFLTPVGPLAALHAALLQAADADETLDVVPRRSLHVTFLALATAVYDHPAEVPAALDSAVAAYHAHLQGVSFRLTRLRLLPLPNALLLAGVPDAATLAARRAFAAALMAGPCRPFLEQRYAGYDIPPRIWHTTLVRCRTPLAAPAVRSLYHTYRDAPLAPVDLGRPLLAYASYNWSRFELIARAA